MTKPREYVVSRASFRLSDLEKNRSKIQKKRKRNSEHWICVYCDRALEEDEENGEERDWTKCDKFKIEMHYDCIPRSHLYETGFTGQGEQYFECELCLNAE